MGSLAAGASPAAFSGVEAPWYVAASWAIDLFLGGQRREHEDLEIAVPRDRLDEVLEALAGFEFFAAGVPGPGQVTPLAHAGAAFETYHQTWVREPATGLWRLDVFRALEPERRRWLAGALELVHPGHRWLLEVG